MFRAESIDLLVERLDVGHDLAMHGVFPGSNHKMSKGILGQVEEYVPGSAKIVLLGVVLASDVALLGGHDGFFSVVDFYDHGFGNSITLAESWQEILGPRPHDHRNSA